MGRPTIYTQELADRFCERIANREPVRTICADEGMPSKTTMFRWLAENPSFRDRYAHAHEERADGFVDEIIEIADDGRRDYVPDGDGGVAVDHDHIRRSQLRVDSRKWVAARLAPKKYGDRLQTEITGADGGPIEVADASAKLLDLLNRRAPADDPGAGTGGDPSSPAG